jgi:hypothetical protein
MKNFEKVTFAILVIVSLLSCQGKKGDTGPTGAAGAIGATGPDAQAPFINGSFSGTVTGTRKDGTAINESFSFPYAVSIEGFSTPVAGIQALTLRRQQSAIIYDQGSVQLYLAIQNKGLANQTVSLVSANYSNQFYFSKQLANNQMLIVDASQGLILSSYTFTYPIDPANTSYNFDFTYYFYSGGVYLNYQSENVNGVYLTYFLTKNNDKVYFYQGNFVKIVDASGNVSFTSSTYGSLVLTQDNKYNYIFKKDGVDLSKTVTVPADTYSISNWNYDKTTGNLSFNIILNYGGYPKPNSTGHPLTVTAAFTGKIYDQIVNGIVTSGQSDVFDK